jgi:hypothetical protein
MLKRLIIVGMILFLLVGINGCQAKPIITERGTVSYIGLAGGSWGIISDKSHNGTNYFEPVFMPLRFRHDGLRIWFMAFLLPYIPNIHMWGERVLIIKIIRFI